MAEIRTILRHPDTQQPLKGKAVTVTLGSPGFETDDHAQILQSSFPRSDVTGLVRIDVTPNDQVTPAGTMYRFKLPGDDWYVLVPSTTPPNTDDTDPDAPVLFWWLDELERVNPSTPPDFFVGLPQPLGDDGQVVGIDNGVPSWIDAAGGGAVTSVFGRAGVVAAQSGDYAAFYDTLGAAAAAQAAAQAASQPLDSDLTAIAALATTTFGRSLLTQADAAALRTTAGLGSAATADTSAFDAAGAASAAQAAAIAAAASDATTKATAAQAASQPLDSDLTAIAALTTTTYGRALLTQADAAATRTTLGLGTAATQATGAFDAAGAAAAAQAASQPLDSDLTAIAALATTSFGRSFLALADAAAGRTLLGLGTLATQSGTFSGTSSGTNTGDQTITLTGDATGTGTGSFVTTLKNTGTAGTYGDATHTVTLTTDAQGRVTAVTTNLITGASLTRQLKTANYNAALGDYVAADTTGGAFTVTLPAASGGKGAVVLKWVAGTLAPSVAVTGSDHFDTSTGSTGGAFTLLNQAATYDSDGTSIWSVRNSFALSTLDTRYALARGLSQTPLSGDYVIPQFYPLGDSSAVAALNEMRFALMYLPAGTYNGLAIRIGSAGGTAGAVIRLGLFMTDAPRGLPGTLIVDGGTVAATSANAYQTVALGSSLVWAGGLVWAAAGAQVAASSYVAYNTGPVLAAVSVNSDTTVFGNSNNLYKATGVSGALASNPTLTYAGNSSNLSPQLGVKAA